MICYLSRKTIFETVFSSISFTKMKALKITAGQQSLTIVKAFVTAEKLVERSP